MQLRLVLVIALSAGLLTSRFDSSTTLEAQSTPATQGRGAAPAAQPPAQPQGGSFISAPARRAGEGRGPFTTFVIRGVTVIDGTGAPPSGPVDIVISNNRIQAIRSAGTPGVPMREGRPPQNPDFEIDGRGKYVLPGFVDMHVHAGGSPKNAEAEYAYKLWLAHGVTRLASIRSKSSRRPP